VIQKYDRGKFIAFLYIYFLSVCARLLAESQAFVFEAAGYLLLSALGARLAFKRRDSRNTIQKLVSARYTPILQLITPANGF
jgi:hypothetical protein